MATFRKRGDLWQVQVRRINAPHVSRSFRHKADAQAWARQVELAADRRTLKDDPRILETITLEQLVNRYIEEVCPRKRAGEFEAILLTAFLRQRRICKRNLASINPSDFANYRDQRLKLCSGSTINREFAILHHLYETAKLEWGYPLFENPLGLIRRPRNNPPRERRLREGEYVRLLKAAEKCRNSQMRPIIMLAVETAMRRGEILVIRRDHIDFKSSRLRIPLTKTEVPRTIPLSSVAVEILTSICGEKPYGDWKLFPMSPNAFRLAWDRLKQRAGINDLHFHDLRHEAVSRLFEQGLGVAHVAAISGHKDFRMLARYTHLYPNNRLPSNN